MMTHEGKNLLFAGVGGQGVLLVAELAARAAIDAGFDAKKTEVHGAAQRGGSVMSHVRFSPKVHSPLIPSGEVDIFLALEKLEGLRWSHYVRPGGVILMNDEQRVPAQLTEQPVDYPENIEPFLTGKGFLVQTINAVAIATELGNYRAANMVLLGAIADQTGIPRDHWLTVIRETLSSKIVELNIKAFDKGCALSQHVLKGVPE